MIALVVGECLRFALAGAALGVAVILGVGERLATLTPGWVGLDALVIGTALLVVLAVAGAGAYMPARRAGATDPATVLRSE